MEVNGLGVARALAIHQIPCIALAQPNWKPACQTSVCKVVYTSSWTKESLINDLKTIGKMLDHKAALLITKDEAVLWISESRNELSKFYEINLPNDDVVNLLMNKQRFIEMSTSEGWPVPLSWTIKDNNDLRSCLQEMIYPCIMKPRIRNSEFRRNSPRKAFKIYNPDELVRLYAMVAQWEKEVLVQEWIEGGDERIAFCLTYYDRNGKPLALFAGRKVRQWPPECGNTAIAEPAPKEWIKPIIEPTEKILQKVKFSGLGSIEYKMRQDTDGPVIMEPTVGRTNYQNEVAVINGLNIPAIAYFDLIRLPYFPLSTPSKPCRLIDGKGEIRAAWKYYRSGKLTIKHWIKDREGKKKYMVLRSNDLRPFVASVFFGVWRILRKVLKKMGLPGNSMLFR